LNKLTIPHLIVVEDFINRYCCWISIKIKTTFYKNCFL